MPDNSRAWLAEVCMKTTAGDVLHTWRPVMAYGMPGERADMLPVGNARVVEVCRRCRQWRFVIYGQWMAPSPGEDG
jgi:hypothetical protein